MQQLVSSWNNSYICDYDMCLFGVFMDTIDIDQKK